MHFCLPLKIKKWPSLIWFHSYDELYRIQSSTTFNVFHVLFPKETEFWTAVSPKVCSSEIFPTPVSPKCSTGVADFPVQFYTLVKQVLTTPKSLTNIVPPCFVFDICKNDISHTGPGLYKIQGMADKYMGKAWKTKARGARLRTTRKRY